jgi:integrase
MTEHDSTVASSGAPGPRLLDRVRQELRLRHRSRRTEEAYVGWIQRFILFNGKRHPSEMGEPEVTRFLTMLATRRNVSASTQNQAASALLFLYTRVLQQHIDWADRVVRAQRPERLPVVLTRAEVGLVLRALHGTPLLMASLLYGSGLRLLECVRLRVKDVCPERNELLVRDGKGQKDRVTMLPERLKQPLIAHLAAVKVQHDADLKAGRGSVALPGALQQEVSAGALGVGVAMGVSGDEILRGHGNG